MYEVVLKTPPGIIEDGKGKNFRTSSEAKTKKEMKTVGKTIQRFRFARFAQHALGSLLALLDVECEGEVSVTVTSENAVVEGRITAWNIASEEAAETALAEVLASAQNIRSECVGCSCVISVSISKRITHIEC